jgi:hypothetical protein
VTKLPEVEARVMGHMIAIPAYNRWKHFLELNMDSFVLDEVKVLDVLSLPDRRHDKRAV